MLDKLPDLPFGLILRKLSHEDRFSLRRTCKTLKLMVDAQVCRNLFLFLDSFPCHKYLFHTGEPIYYADSCRVPDFDRFISSNCLKTFRLIKKLTIFFEGLYKLENYLSKLNGNLDRIDEDDFLQEAWLLQIDLEDLNAFEQLEHLEIKVGRRFLRFTKFSILNSFPLTTQGVGRVVGQLQLKQLKICSIETRRLSQFDLDCPALEAMHISFGARPNFINRPHPLDCLSIGLLFWPGTFEYLHNLFKQQCPNLSTIGFEFFGFLETLLGEVNAGSIKLPRWRVIKFNYHKLQMLTDELGDSLVQYEKNIKPDNLRIIFNDEPITLSQFISIIQPHQAHAMPQDLLATGYLNFLKEQNLIDLSWLLRGISKLVLGDIEIDEDLVMKLRHLKVLVISSGRFPIDETLFRQMLSTWTELEVFRIYRPNPKATWPIGQHQLEEMPIYWPNMLCLSFGERPQDLKFVAKFKNLRKLTFRVNLPREDTMFLMQALPSLYHIGFHNQRTDFSTCLNTKKRAKYWKSLKMFPKYMPTARQKYLINHYHEKDSVSYLRAFKSLDEMVDHYYDRDLFNQRNASSFKPIRNLFKSL